MADLTTANTDQLWRYLGSVWGNLTFDDKEFFETLWEIYGQIIDEELVETGEINLSKSLNDFNAAWTKNHAFFDIIYAVDDEATHGDLINTNVQGGRYTYPLEDITLTLSGMVNYYWLDHENEWVAEPLTLDEDYYISGYNTLVFLNDPPFTPSENYPGIYRSLIYIEYTRDINPVMFDLWGAQLDLFRDTFTNNDFTLWSQYSSGLTLELERASHYKNIIRALTYWALQKPTIPSVQNSTGIAMGLPFAYEAGTVVFDTTSGSSPYRATLGDQELYFSTAEERNYIVSGYVDRFELLVDRYNVYDYNLSGALIENYADIYQSNIRNILVGIIDSDFVTDFPFTYNQDFYENYLERVIPSYHEFIEPVIPAGIQR